MSANESESLDEEFGIMTTQQGRPDKTVAGTKDRPLITIALFGYNQECFIREAIEGALSQSYSPLEIILSDDCSPDGTFAIMEEMAAEYTGPHKIILNRNEKNLGLSAHIDQAVGLSQGDWIVVASGDDISFSERVERIYAKISEEKEPVSAVYSSVKIIDGKGQVRGSYKGHDPAPLNDLSQRFETPFLTVLGCSAAYHRDVFDRFGEIIENAEMEDVVLGFRAGLLGRILRLEEPLVAYRRHEDAVTGWKKISSVAEFKEKRRRHAEWNIRALFNFIKDVQLDCSERCSAALRADLLAAFKKWLWLENADVRFMSESMIKNLWLLVQCIARGAPARRVLRWGFRILFPHWWMKRNPREKDTFLDEHR